MDNLRKCFELIIYTWKRDKVTICEAGGFLHWLQDRKFFNLSELFPSVDATGRYSICSTAKAPGLFYIHSECLQNFVKSISNVREIKFPDIFHNTSCTMVRSSSIDEETYLITKEVCEGLSLLNILVLPLFLTVVHSPVLKNAFQPRLWKLLQNHFLFLMKAVFILSSL